MEKITSGLPPSLYHYTHHTHYPPHPQIIQTLISHTLSLSLSKTIRLIVLLLYRFLPLSLSLPLSLLSISRLPPLLSHKGFVFFLLNRSAVSQFWSLFTRTISHFKLLHFWVSMWLPSVNI